MGSENESNSLRLERYSGRKIVGVGLPGDRGVFLQEYWDTERPCYAVANISGAPIELNVSEWNDGRSGNRLFSREIASNSVQFLEIEEPIMDYRGDLLAISLDQNSFLGLLKAPVRAHIQDRLGEFLTIDGLNGLGARDANIRCWQDRLSFDGNEVISLILEIPGAAGTIFLNEGSDGNDLPRSVVRDASSQTLGVEKRNEIIEISNNDYARTGMHKVSLEVVIPPVKERTMTFFSGRTVVREGGSFHFARGLVAG